MRALVLHNRYAGAAPSGENRVVDSEIEALNEAGVDVETLMPSSDSIRKMSLKGKASAAMTPMFGLSSANQLDRLLTSFRPDVVHLHNPYPLISPSAIASCVRAGIPIVATIHNFRLRCINGLFYRDGAICTDCEDRRVAVPGVIHGCYRGSHLQSAMMSAAIARHRSNWNRLSRYIAVSEFVADRLRAWGAPDDTVVVKYNPVEDPGEPTPVGRGFLFAGRLSEEKGIMLLLDAWALSGLGATSRLIVAGDGPQRNEAEERARTLQGVSFEGMVSASRVAELRRETGVSICCSTCFEAHPAIAESFSHGRPVVSTDVGALAGLVDDEVGWSAPANAVDLASALRSATDPVGIELRGIAARQRYVRSYRSDVVAAQLISIYESVIS